MICKGIDYLNTQAVRIEQLSICDYHVRTGREVRSPANDIRSNPREPSFQTVPLLREGLNLLLLENENRTNSFSAPVCIYDVGSEISRTYFLFFLINSSQAMR